MRTQIVLYTFGCIDYFVYNEFFYQSALVVHQLSLLIHYKNKKILEINPVPNGRNYFCYPFPLKNRKEQPLWPLSFALLKNKGHLSKRIHPFGKIKYKKALIVWFNIRLYISKQLWQKEFLLPWCVGLTLAPYWVTFFV